MRENAEKIIRKKNDEMDEIQKEIKKEVEKEGPKETINETEDKPLKGGVKVTLKNCTNLNVRKKPIKDNQRPVTIVDKYDKITVISTVGEEWLKLKVEKEFEPNIEYVGYAMSEFLTRVE